MTTNNINYVFVYGTLKSSGGNNVLLSQEALVGKGVTARNFILRDNGYPYACPPKDEDYPRPLPILGEIWTCDDATLKRLDNLEGYEGPDNRYNHYERCFQPIKLVEDGSLYKCYMYLYKGDTFGLPLCNTYKGQYYWGSL